MHVIKILLKYMNASVYYNCIIYVYIYINTYSRIIIRGKNRVSALALLPRPATTSRPYYILFDKINCRIILLAVCIRLTLLILLCHNSYKIRKYYTIEGGRGFCTYSYTRIMNMMSLCTLINILHQCYSRHCWEGLKRWNTATMIYSFLYEI